MREYLRNQGVGYVLAVLLTATVGLLRLVFRDVPPEAAPYLAFVLPVVLAGWYGGLKPGLFATGLSSVLNAYLLLPTSPYAVNLIGEAVGLGLFLAVGLTVSGLCESLHVARRRLEADRAKLRESDEFHEAIAELAADFAFSARVEPDGTAHTEAVTDGFAKVLGYTREELAARGGWGILVHPDDRTQAEEGTRRLMAGRPIEGEMRHVTKDGRVLWLQYMTRPVVDASGRVVRLYGAARDVSQRRRAEAALREADRRKDEFLATLAHELRNPLAPIHNSVQLLRMLDTADPGLCSAVEIIDRQAVQMARLIDDLMDVARITRGRLRLRKERIELAAAARQACEGVASLMAEAGHELTVALPPEPVYLDADPTRLSQVITNLLTNAAKYTERGGRVWLTAGREGDEAVVSVRDTGVGIAAEHLPRLFEMFSQIDSALERSEGGLGIGLSLVHGLVSLHGGRVEAHSGGPGQGSEFIVRLPLEAGEPQSGGAKAEGGPVARGVRRRILVVDDSRDNAASLSRIVRHFGYDTRAAHDGEEAVQAAADYRPDVVLLDIGLPKLNGYEAARRIREQPWGRTVVLVAVTGWGQEDDRRRAREAGFDHHMTKPVDLAALEKLLAELPPGGPES